MADEVIPSFNAQVRALQPGESLAKVERYQLGDPEAANIPEILSRMRRAVNTPVSRIRAAGSNFRVESGAMITSDNEAVMVVVTVSRL